VVEGRNLDLRLFLEKYESVVEGQRRMILTERQDVLTGDTPCASDLERAVTLSVIDDAWAEHLAAVNELKEGTVWVSLGGGAPHHGYLTSVHEQFVAMRGWINEEIPRRLAQAEAGEWDPRRPGATWTYLTTDQPFGTMTERVMKGLARMVKRMRR